MSWEGGAGGVDAGVGSFVTTGATGGGGGGKEGGGGNAGEGGCFPTVFSGIEGGVKLS